MKTKILNTIGILALAATINNTAAQTTVPNTFSYQAVITNEDGSPVSNHDITVEVSIRQGNDCETNTSCPVLWQELHAPKTNEFGGFNIEIGDSKAISTTSGSLSKYSDINWLNTTAGSYYMQVRVDFGEASYLNGMTDLGTTRFSSVPYALAAEKADFANAISTDANGNIANKIGQLADVSIKNAKANQILVFDGTAWKNTDPAAAQGLTNINISKPQNGDHLVYNATTSLWENKTMEKNKINDLADVTLGTTINGSDVLIYNSNSNIWENKPLKLNTIKDVNATGATNGQVLTYNGTFWEAKDAAAPGGETITELAKLTGDVNISNASDGQILKYVEKNGKKFWQNADPSANDIWVANSSGAYTSYPKVGIGTTEPASILHIKDGTNNTLFNARGITIGGSFNRIKTTASIALGNGTENDVEGTAVLAGNGSTAGTSAVNSIIMGKDSRVNSSCSIVIGDGSSTSFAHCAAFGQNLTAGFPYQYLFGKYNTYCGSASNMIFIVANGTSKTETKNIFTIDNDGNVTCTGTVSGSSDARLKTRITTMPNALEDLLKLRGVTFNWNKTVSPNASDKTQYGFIAQEVEKIFPDLVGTDSNGYKTVNYIGVIPVLTEAIKTQQEEIKELKTENEQLKSSIEQLLKRVEALEKR